VKNGIEEASVRNQLGAASLLRRRLDHEVIDRVSQSTSCSSDLRPKLLIRVIWDVWHRDDHERMFHAYVASIASCGHLTIGGRELRGVGGFDRCID